jgi:hypothetical protein
MRVRYCTLAVTLALPLRVNVQVFSFSPPVEHAPDQTASRPSEMLSVMDVPTANEAEPVLPTLTLIPDGLDDTVSPLRPVAVTVSVAPWLGALTVSVAVRVSPSCVAEIVTGVDALTLDVVTVNVALVAPAATVTLEGTLAAVLLLDSNTTRPPAGASAESVTRPCEVAPPVTLVGFTVTLCTLAGGAGGGSGVTVSVAVLLAPS